MKSNEIGFSLVELMLVAAGLGALALIGVQITSNQNKAMVKTNLNSDMQLTLNEINAILSDPVKCMNTLGGKNALSTTSGINAINSSKYYSVASGSAPASGYGNSNLTIDSYALSSTSAEVASNYSYLVVNFQNKNILKGTSGAALLPKRISLYVEVDGANNITKCRALSSSTSTIWSRGNGSQIFYSGGNVGVGVSNPIEMLDIDGNVHLSNSNSIKWGSGGNYIQGDTTGFTLGYGASGQLNVDNTGNLSLATGNINLASGNLNLTSGKIAVNKSSASSQVDVNGDVRSSGVVYATSMQYTSDLKYKKEINQIKNPVDKIMSLRGVKFKWKANDLEDYGFIAQEVKPVLPIIVKDSPDQDYLTVDYAKIVPVLLEAVKEQQVMINQLKSEIKKLKNDQMK